MKGIFAFSALAVPTLLGVTAAPTHADLLLLSQERTLTCYGRFSFWDFANNQLVVHSDLDVSSAPDFARYADERDVDVFASEATALANQDSSLSPLGIVARGNANATVTAGGVSDDAIARSRSFVSVYFSIAEPTTFALTGRLFASRQIWAPQEATYGTALRIADTTGTLFEAIAGDAHPEVLLDETITLQPGTYTYSIDADMHLHAPSNYNVRGRVDESYQVTFMITEPPICQADWDESGTVDSGDFFAFLTDFFNDHADFNQDGATTSQDFFDFLGAFFQGC